MSIIKKHYWAVVVAVLIGLIYVLPNLLMPRLQKQENVNGKFTPVSIEASELDEIAIYGVQLRRAMDGDKHSGDPYLAEYQDIATVRSDKFLAGVLGWPARFFGVSDIKQIFVWSDFIFPALIFLLIYILFWALTSEKAWSIFGGILFTAFPNLSAYASVLNPLHWKDLPLSDVFGIVGRGFDPAVTRLFVPGAALPFFVLFLLLTQKLVSGSRKLLFVVASAVSYGLLFYIYFYYWVFATGLLGILFIFLLFRKNAQRKFIFLELLGGLVVGIPFWIRYYTASQASLAAELAQRSGLELGRFFRLTSLDNLIFVIVASISLYFFVRRRYEIEKNVLFVLAAAWTMIAVLNIQLLTGFNVQPDHWGSRVNVYILVILAITILFWINKIFVAKYEKRAATVLIFLSALLLLTGFVSKTEQSWRDYSRYTLPTELTDSFDWINENIAPDSVFITPSSKMDHYLPLFTHTRIYMASACYTSASISEMEQRFLESYAFFGVKKNYLRQSLLMNLVKSDNNNDILRKWELDPVYMMYCDNYRAGGFIGNSLTRPVGEGIYNPLLAKYQALLNQPKSLIIKPTYQANYVYWGPYEKWLAPYGPEHYTNIKKVYSNNLVQIYAI